MVISILFEDKAINDDFLCGNGLSLYLETDGFKIIMDCGLDNSFLINAKRMNLNIEDIDFLIISHGHYDHGGGIADFLKINKKAKVILEKSAFDEYYSLDCNNKKKYIGLDKKTLTNDRIIFIDDYRKINSNAFIIGNFNYIENENPLNNRILKFENGNYSLDTFNHEIAIVILEGDNCFVISGCYHSGVERIITKSQQIAGQPATHAIGGFHLCDSRGKCVSDEYFSNLATFLIGNNLKCLTGHCSGETGYRKLKNLNVDIEKMKSGSVFKL